MGNTAFWKQFALAAVISMAGVLIVWLLPSVTSPDILVDTPSAEDQKLEWYGPSLAILFPYGLVAGIVAGLLVHFRKPRTWWYAIVAVTLVAIGVQAFAQSNTTESGIWLNVMHLVAAAVFVPTVARFLPESSSARSAAAF